MVTKAYQWRGSTGPKHKKLFILLKCKELEKNVLYSGEPASCRWWHYFHSPFRCLRQNRRDYTFPIGRDPLVPVHFSKTVPNAGIISWIVGICRFPRLDLQPRLDEVKGMHNAHFYEACTRINEDNSFGI